MPLFVCLFTHRCQPQQGHIFQSIQWSELIKKSIAAFSLLSNCSCLFGSAHWASEDWTFSYFSCKCTMSVFLQKKRFTTGFSKKYFIWMIAYFKVYKLELNQGLRTKTIIIWRLAKASPLGWLLSGISSLTSYSWILKLPCSFISLLPLCDIKTAYYSMVHVSYCTTWYHWWNPIVVRLIQFFSCCMRPISRITPHAIYLLRYGILHFEVWTL